MNVEVGFQMDGGRAFEDVRWYAPVLGGYDVSLVASNGIQGKDVQAGKNECWVQY
jgi:hypothetical protein